jgi:GABA(A) receptor-associated protein
MSNTFKRTRTVGDRITMCGDARARFPTRVPIICEPGRNAVALQGGGKCKFLVPESLTVGQFSYIMRKRLKGLSAHKALYLTCNGVLPCTRDTVGEIYGRSADKEDGLLYVNYSLESTFGGFDLI